MIPLDVKLNEDYFWIEQNHGCSFPFVCDKGIVKFVNEVEDKPEDEMSLDAKMERKLKKDFNGKHILELKKTIDKLPHLRIKNHFVCDEFEKHDIFKYRREPERSLEHIEQLKGFLTKIENSSTTGFGEMSKADAIEHYKNQIAQTEQYIKELPKNPAFIKAKTEYETKVIHPMRMRHGITYGINNVVHFT